VYFGVGTIQRDECNKINTTLESGCETASRKFVASYNNKMDYFLLAFLFFEILGAGHSTPRRYWYQITREK
jgi:hypothetical protein